MATIQLSNATFYRAGASGVSNVVGIERSQPRIVRYEFQAPSEGASSVSLRFTDWTDSGAPIPAQLRCCIDQSPDSHTNTSDGSPYTCTLSRSDTYLPIYMTMFLHKKKNKSLIYKIDLGPLGAK